jgi:2-iminobutanoate/2-iminopropanoate deaminase
MATKTALHNDQQPDLRSIFNWGLKITNFNELFIVTGHGDTRPDFSASFPGDPVAQTRHILDQMKALIERAGYSLNDIIRHDWTFTKDVTQEQFQQIIDVWTEFLAEVEVKPANGTLRYVDRLASPEMMVEYEIIVAR